MSTIELISAYHKVFDYFDSLNEEEKMMLTLDVNDQSISFHDKGIVPSINLCNDLKRVPEYCSGTNAGLILCCCLPHHELEHAEQYISAVNEEACRALENDSFIKRWNDGKRLHSFILSHRNDYVKIIAEDILKLFGINSAFIIQIIKANPKRVRFNLLFIVLSVRENKDILKTLQEIESSQITAHAKLSRCSNLVGGRQIRVKEMISFMAKAIITLMDYVSKEDLLQYMITYEEALL